MLMGHVLDALSPLLLLSKPEWSQDVQYNEMTAFSHAMASL